MSFSTLKRQHSVGQIDQAESKKMKSVSSFDVALLFQLPSCIRTQIYDNLNNNDIYTIILMKPFYKEWKEGHLISTKRKIPFVITLKPLSPEMGFYDYTKVINEKASCNALRIFGTLKNASHPYGIINVHQPLNSCFPSKLNDQMNKNCTIFVYHPNHTCYCESCLKKDRFLLTSSFPDLISIDKCYDPYTMIDSDLFCNLQELWLNCYWFDRILYAFGSTYLHRRPIKKIILGDIVESTDILEPLILKNISYRLDSYENKSLKTDIFELPLLDWSKVKFPACKQLHIYGLSLPLLMHHILVSNLYFTEATSLEDLFPNIEDFQLQYDQSHITENDTIMISSIFDHIHFQTNHQLFNKIFSSYFLRSKSRIIWPLKKLSFQYYGRETVFKKLMNKFVQLLLSSSDLESINVGLNSSNIIKQKHVNWNFPNLQYLRTNWSIRVDLDSLFDNCKILNYVEIYDEFTQFSAKVLSKLPPTLQKIELYVNHQWQIQDMVDNANNNAIDFTQAISLKQFYLDALGFDEMLSKLKFIFPENIKPQIIVSNDLSREYLRINF